MSILGIDISNSKTATIVLAAIIVFIVVGLLIKKRPQKKNKKYFRAQWRALQANCKERENWATAIFQADDLLVEALKSSKVKGKTTGERLVSAQNLFSDNEEVWNAHKLRTRLEDKPSTVLKKTDVKKALLAFGQAMKDLEVM